MAGPLDGVVVCRNELVPRCQVVCINLYFLDLLLLLAPRLVVVVKLACDMLLQVVLAQSLFKVEGGVCAFWCVSLVLTLVLFLELASNVQDLSRALRVYIALLVGLVCLAALLALGLVLVGVGRKVFLCERVVSLVPHAGRLGYSRHARLLGSGRVWYFRGYRFGAEASYRFDIFSKAQQQCCRESQKVGDKKVSGVR